MMMIMRMMMMMMTLRDLGEVKVKVNEMSHVSQLCGRGLCGTVDCAEGHVTPFAPVASYFSFVILHKQFSYC